MREVRVSADLARRIAEQHGPDRSTAGLPSEWDFWSGPLSAARIGFRDFEALPFDPVPAVRALHFVDPVFGALVFVGVLLTDGIVEIADYQADDDYWRQIAEDPEG